MLQRVHELTRGWFAWLIISLVSVTFVIFGIESYTRVHNSNSDAAVVNGESITEAELKAATERLKRKMAVTQQIDRNTLDQMNESIKQSALEDLLATKILGSASKKAGFDVSLEQAQMLMMTFPAFMEDGKFSEERFKQALRFTSESPESFLQQIRQDMIFSQIETGISDSVFILPSEFEKAVSLMAESRKIEYGVLYTDAYREKINLSDAELRKYYQDHISEFMVPESIKVDYITLGKEDLSHEIKISENEIKTYYEQNKSDYKIPQEWKVAQILIQVPFYKDNKRLEQAENIALSKANSIKAEIDKGVSFEALAKSKSEDISTKAKGGELPWIKHGSLDARFESAVSNLKKGEVSEPVRTQYGYNIIKLLDTKEESTASLESLRPQIKQRLEQEAIAKKYETINEDLTNLAFMQPDSLSEISKQYHRPIQTSAWFNRQGNDDKITQSPKVIAAAFSQEVLQEGNNSDVIALDENTLIVLRIKEHQASSVKPFEEVKAVIESTMKTEKAQAIALSMAKTPDKIPSHDIRWIKIERLLRPAKTPDPAIIDAAFALPKPTTQNPLPATGIVLSDKEVAIIRLLSITPGKTGELTETEKSTYRDLILRSRASLEFQLFFQSLKDEAEVKNYVSKNA